jgi:hypothetical protein
MLPATLPAAPVPASSLPASAVVAAAPPHATAADAIEWTQLEAARAAEWSSLDADGRLAPWHAIESAVKYSDRPHPDSYGASLPMRTSYGANGYPRIPALTAAEKRSIAERAGAAPASRALVRASSPHADGYRPDLPLRSELGGRNTKRWTLSAAEKATLAGRPIRYNREG